MKHLDNVEDQDIETDPLSVFWRSCSLPAGECDPGTITLVLLISDRGHYPSSCQKQKIVIVMNVWFGLIECDKKKTFPIFGTSIFFLFSCRPLAWANDSFNQTEAITVNQHVTGGSPLQKTRNTELWCFDVVLFSINKLFANSRVVGDLRPRCTKVALQWRHNEHDGFSNHRVFRCRSKKTPRLCVTGLCEGDPQVTGGFLSQRARICLFPFDDVIVKVTPMTRQWCSSRRYWYYSSLYVYKKRTIIS